MICKISHIRYKLSAYLLNQSSVSAKAGTTGKDLAIFRNAKTWESRKKLISFRSTVSSDQDTLLYSITLYNFKYITRNEPYFLIRNF